MKKYTILLGALLSSGFAFSQVGVNTDQPKATFDIMASPSDASKTDGFIAPRLKGSELKAKDALYAGSQTGAIVYITEALLPADITAKTTNVTAVGYFYFDGSVWQKVGNGSTAITEPWNIQGTTNPATANTQNIYQTGSIAVGKNSVYTNGTNPVMLDVVGAVRGGSGHTGAVGASSAAFGFENEASGEYSSAMGKLSITSGENSMAVGRGATASGPVSLAIGGFTTASGGTSVAMGNSTTASGINSVAMGQQSKAQGTASVAMGEYTTASGVNSVAMGTSATAAGGNAVAIGYQTNAANDNSVAMGSNTKTTAQNAFAMGRFTTASGMGSVAMGSSTTASSYNEVALGSLNAITLGTASSIVGTDAAFQIGTGSGVTPANALTVLKNANTGIGITGTEAAAKPTERLDIGSGNVRVRDINTNTGLGTDKIVVADGTGILKTISSNTLAPKANNGLIVNSNYVQLGGPLIQATTINQAANVLTFTGTVQSLVKISNTAGTVTTPKSALQIVDGSEASGKVLTSDASGNTSWTYSSLKAITGTFPLDANAVSFTSYGTGDPKVTSLYTGASITLPPGKWMVAFGSLASMGQNDRINTSDAQLWCTAFLSNSTSSAVPTTDYIPTYTGVSGSGGSIGRGMNRTMVSGAIAINNTSAANKTYYLWANQELETYPTGPQQININGNTTLGTDPGYWVKLFSSGNWERYFYAIPIQ